MLQEINVRELPRSVISMISDEWALLTAGKKDDYNTMTVSWGALGELWGRDVAFCFVRPQRYTLEFLNKNDYFTLTFFDGGYKKEMGVCGSKSGRDIDKAKETGLEPISVDGDATSFAQAKYIIKCKKIAVQDVDPKSFIDPTIMDNYELKDYHKVFIGQIEKVYKIA